MKVTINSTKAKSEVDFSKPQLLISEKGKIVFANGTHSEDYFSGCEISSKGVVSRSQWIKSVFQVFTDSLTISNE